MIMNKLILGTAQLGLNYGINNIYGQPSLDNSLNILEKANNLGIKYLDTAESYGNAHSLINKYHIEYPEKKFLIFDKISYNKNNKIEDFEKNFEYNLSFLKINSFHGFMFHSVNIFYQNIYIYKNLIKLKKNGSVKNVGISVYTNSEILKIINDGYEFDFIQMPFNVFDNEFQRIEVINKMMDHKIKIHVRSIFLQGLFYMERNLLPKKLKPLKKYLIELDMLCKKSKISIDELLISYVKNKKYIDKIIFGIDNLDQLNNNIKIYNKNISAAYEVIDQIEIKNKDLLNPVNWQ